MRMTAAFLSFVAAGVLLGSNTALPQGALPTTLHEEAEITVNQGASADGFLRVAIQPQNGAKREATIAVTKSMGENDIAQKIADALRSAVGPDYVVDKTPASTSRFARHSARSRASRSRSPSALPGSRSSSTPELRGRYVASEARATDCRRSKHSLPRSIECHREQVVAMDCVSFKTAYRFQVWLWLSCWLSPSVVMGQEFSQLFVVGDSLSDTGNAAAARDAAVGVFSYDKTLSYTFGLCSPLDSDLESCGLVFFEKSRVSDGPVAVERLSEGLNLGPSAPSFYLLPLIGIDRPSVGTNYAVASAKARASGFEDLTSQVDALLLDHSRPDLPARALYLFAIGGNDALDALQAVAAFVTDEPRTESSGEIIEAAVEAIAFNVERLINSGARLRSRAQHAKYRRAPCRAWRNGRPAPHTNPPRCRAPGSSIQRSAVVALEGSSAPQSFCASRDIRSLHGFRGGAGASVFLWKEY